MEERLNSILSSYEGKNEELIPTLTKVWVVPIKTFEASLKIVTQIREAGIPADIDITGRNLTKNLDYANKMKIPFVVICGKKEVIEDKVTVRNMESGEQQLVSVTEAIKIIEGN